MDIQHMLKKYSNTLTTFGLIVVLIGALIFFTVSPKEEIITPNATPQSSLNSATQTSQLLSTPPAPDTIPGEGECADGHDWKSIRIIDVPATTRAITIEGTTDDGDDCAKWVLISDKGYYVDVFDNKAEAQKVKSATKDEYSLAYVAEGGSSTFYILETEAVQHTEYKCKVCGETFE